MIHDYVGYEGAVNSFVEVYKLTQLHLAFEKKFYGKFSSITYLDQREWRGY